MMNEREYEAAWNDGIERAEATSRNLGDPVEDLADTLRHSNVGEDLGGDEWDYDPMKATQAVLAAGYRKPRIVATLEELRWLPDTSAYLMASGDIGRVRNWEANSHCVMYVDASMGSIAKEDVPLPVTIIWEPSEWVGGADD